jgi:hypothetical protein
MLAEYSGYAIYSGSAVYAGWRYWLAVFLCLICWRYMLATLSGHGDYTWLSMQAVQKSFKKCNEHNTYVMFERYENSKWKRL